MAATPATVGVDNGGTWIRLEALDAQGGRLWSLQKPSPSVEKLSAFLHQHLKRFRGELHGLAVGSRGVWKQAKRRSLQRALQGLAKKIVVMSDVEAAWMAAFKSQGIIVISGTGSIAYGRTADGHFARAGGLGPEKGDEGSGYWIGKQWLGRKLDGSPITTSGMTTRETAALAPLVIQKARAGNPTAVLIIREAQFFLSDLVIQLTKTLNIKGPVPVSYSGSVLENKWFRAGLFRLLAKKRVRLIQKKATAATALARSIIDHASR